MALTTHLSAQDADEKYATELLKQGVAAPDFTLKTADGKTFSMSSLRGKYIVLDFWATWCPDCRKDVPEMKRLHQAYASDKVAFVGVSFDTDATAWRTFVTQNDMNWTHVSELKKMKETAIAKTYGVKWIPSVYIIDPDGKVLLGTVMIEKVGKTLESIHE